MKLRKYIISILLISVLIVTFAVVGCKKQVKPEAKKDYKYYKQQVKEYMQNNYANDQEKLKSYFEYDTLDPTKIIGIKTDEATKEKLYNVETLYIPNNVKKISFKKDAPYFKMYQQIKRLVIPENVTELDGQLCYDNSIDFVFILGDRTAATKLEIDATFFNNCNALRYVYFENLTNLEIDEAKDKDSNLEHKNLLLHSPLASIKYDKDSSTGYKVEDGFLIEQDGDEKILVASGILSKKSIPSGVTKIKALALANITGYNLEIKLPNSLDKIDSIEEGAFLGLVNKIAKITIDDDLTHLKLMDKCLLLDGKLLVSELNTESISAAATVLGAYSVINVKTNSEGKFIVPSTIERINSYAFAGKNLKKIEIEDGINSLVLEDYALSRAFTIPNTPDEKIQFTIPSRISRIGKSFLYGCKIFKVEINKKKSQITLDGEYNNGIMNADYLITFLPE